MAIDYDKRIKNGLSGFDVDIVRSKKHKKEGLLVPVGFMKRERAMEIKESLNCLIQKLVDKENIHNSIGGVNYQAQPILSLFTNQGNPKEVT